MGVSSTVAEIARDINERRPEIATMWLSTRYMDPAKREFHAIKGLILHILEEFTFAVSCYDKALQCVPSTQQYEFNMNMLKSIQECRTLALDEQPIDSFRQSHR